VTLTPHPLLVPRSKNRVLSLRAFVAYEKGKTHLLVDVDVNFYVESDYLHYILKSYVSYSCTGC
jgi:hypothetical protein